MMSTAFLMLVYTGSGISSIWCKTHLGKPVLQLRWLLPIKI
ncbi:hypothetical protein Hanom_Chr04g00344571 [Helianthus anomalus]